MDSKKLIQKIISFILAWLIIFNYCDLNFINIIVNLNDVMAEETLNPTALWANKMDSLGWINENNEPQAKMWADTTKIKAAWINAENAGVGKASSATSIGLPINDVVVSESAMAVSDYAYDPDMATEDIPTLYYTLEYDEVLNGYYRIYYVSTANQLMQLLSMSYNTNTNIRPNATEIKTYVEDYKTTTSVAKLGIKLLCDIDLGGSNDKYWIGTSNSSVYLDIDGDENKIYNGYFSRIENGKNPTTGATIYINYTFLNNSAQHFYIHDVDFDNMFIARPGGIFGTSIFYSYFDNVNFEHCLAVSDNETGVAIVLGYSYLRDYFNNCMIRNSYVCGRGHCATFASYNGGTSFDSTVSYIGDTDSTATSFYYTDIPPSIEEVEKVWKGYDTVYEGKTYTLNNVRFPSIYKNSMAIDCEVYELALNHSGTFVSCLQSQIIFKNCFTNSTIYATAQSGVFTGCVIGCGDGFYYNVEGKKTLVNSYFENCYTSGLIEGKTSVGGFIGGIFNDNRAYGYDTNKNVAYTQYRGKTVCKNCYSTSSVGMQYSGTYVGGFVGQVYGNIRSEGTDSDKQHLFINCYAAGEVGGITTDTSIATTNTNSIGGFFGSYLKTDPDTITTANKITFDDDALIPLVCKNCYYDKQTTAMRERDVGNYNSKASLNGSVDGLTGVYTRSSEQKKVDGLTDYTKSIMNSTSDDDVWTYVDGYYPQLNVFVKDAEKYFGNKAEIARLYSQASASTVFLNHWDTYMNEDGDVVQSISDTEASYILCDDETVYDTVRDITSKFEFTSGGNSGESNLGWQVNTSKNNESDFATYLGGNATDDNGNIIGFDVDFAYTDGGEEKSVTENFTPQVLKLTAEYDSDGSDYIFKCDNFAEGKQFVKVTTCQGDDYAKWKLAMDKYNKYIEELNEYEVAKIKYGTLLGVEDTDPVIKEFAEKVKSDAGITDAADTTATALEKRLFQLSGIFSNIFQNSNELIQFWLNYDIGINYSELWDFNNKDSYSYFRLLFNELVTNYVNDSKYHDLLVDLKVIYDHYVNGYINNLPYYIAYVDNTSQQIKDLSGDSAKNYIKDWLEEYQPLTDKYNAGTITDDEKQKLIEMFYNNCLLDEYDENEVKALCIEISSYTIYPLAEPTSVKEPVDFESYISGESSISSKYGTRTLRLIPMAYLDAGDMITVNVYNQGGSDTESAITNEVVVNINGGTSSITMDNFDHTIGVLYSATQGLPAGNISTKLGDPTYYNPQNVVKNSTEYYDAETRTFNDTNLTANNVFALYDYYPSKKDKATMEGSDKADGFGKLVNQVSLGNFYSNGSQSSGGKTEIEVYKAELRDNVDGYDLVLDKTNKANWVNFTVGTDDENATNIQKWMGEKAFDSSDEGYYYMVYYWKMDDGRYLEEYKIVHILANSFDVEMRTGVAGMTTDTFISENAYNTAIDCDVLASDMFAEYKFPSDTYDPDGDENWEDYAKETYYTYADTLNYDNIDYWSKSRYFENASGGVTVAWRKNADYALVKLIVEVYTAGKWVPMVIAMENENGNFVIDENESPEYSHRYSSYTVVQNPKTEQFYVVTTNNTVRSFKVLSTDSGSLDAGSVRYINFQFMDSNSGQSFIEFNDDIRVTALFRKVAADVIATETVLIDDGISVNDLVKNGDEYIALDKAEEYRSVDNTGLETSEQKAVLFGDNLIYRKKIQNIGQYSANNVVVVEDIPEGLSLVDGSIKLYRQPRTINIASDDEFLDLEEVTLYTSDTLTDYATESYSYEYDEENRQIIWRLNPVSMNYDYYVQFEATVDNQYNIFKEQYDAQANFGYVYVNGDVDDSSALGDLNTNYGEHAIYNINSTETVDENGEIHYKFEIGQRDDLAGSYYVTNIYNELPDGYELVEKSVEVKFTNPSDEDNFTISKTSSILSVTPNNSINYILDGDNTITISYTIKPKEDADLSLSVKNKITFLYESTNDIQLQNSLTRVTSVTNSVTSDARWLYLNVEKEIENEDSEQSFLFEIINQDISYTLPNTILANINCVKNGDVYKGNQIIQIGTRGYYDVTETYWANTDYDIDWAEYYTYDIDLDNAVKEGSYNDDGSRAVIQSSGEKGFYLPRAMYKSTAFPLWVTEDEDGSIIYPTVNCYNYESDYAWLSSQTNVDNSFNLLDSNILSSSRAAQSPVLPVIPKDKTATPSAVITEPITIKEDEDGEQ